MTKKAGTVPEETRERLIEAAEAEFADHGYAKSSVRRISEEAGVTTGALYFFFRDKDDIFRAVIESVTVPFMKIIREHYEAEAEFEAGDEAQDADLRATRAALSFYASHRKAFSVLISHRDREAVRDFFREFTDCSVEHYIRETADMKRPPRRTDLEMFVRMQLDLMLSLAGRDLGKEEMTASAETVTRMLRGAFTALVSC